MSAIYDWSVLALRNVYDRRIQGKPVLDSAALFPDAERFTAQWRQIREALTVAHDLHNIPRFHEIAIQQESISANDARDWRMFIMKAYGQPIARNGTLPDAGGADRLVAGRAVRLALLHGAR